MDPITLRQMTGRVSQLLAERLGARGRTLRDRLKSRSRALPRRVRRAAELLAEAEALAASPRMMRQADMGEIAEAYDICVNYLRPLGSGARAQGLLRSIAASVVFGLVVVGALVLAVGRLRGLF
ncbi:hypothetical protein EOW65_08270 [Sinirhodobacter ferrireducens]|uniref:Uncharacterized protein n=1 Tax=Paenirhodobacter ferrireducens TaxID=1215032 RepID=A0A443LL68_9RHOB|nr:hypothetical protein [Sinirhodobacter ferrireducens]RWR49937.1 hypothetical protein EOW65_08270 [Sinirhodobacter ferrireducens]